MKVCQFLLKQDQLIILAHIHSAAQIAHKALYCIICFLCIVLTGIVDRSQYIIR